MAYPARAHEVDSWQEPRSVKWSTHYLKKLLIERHAIRAALEHPGGSIITAGPAQAADASELPSYSPVIGNDYHLDLIIAEQATSLLNKRDMLELLAWCDGLSAVEAAQWANIRGGRIRACGKAATARRVERNIERATKEAGHDDAGTGSE